MNELITVEVNQNNEQVVSARELHNRLGIHKHFTQWFEQQLNQLGLLEGEDFLPLRLESTGGRPSTDYHITLEIAKHLAMISGGERAHQLRQYFIEVEKAWNTPEKIMARALIVSNQMLRDYKKRLDGAERFQNQIASSQNSLLVREIAKIASKKGITIGEKTLWSKLRDWRLIMPGKTEPYQKYLDRGYFEITEGVRESSKGTFTYRTTRVTGKGKKYILERLIEEYWQGLVVEDA